MTTLTDLRALAEAAIRIGGDIKACVFYGVSCDPKWSAREAIDAAIAKGKG